MLCVFPDTTAHASVRRPTDAATSPVSASAEAWPLKAAERYAATRKGRSRLVASGDLDVRTDRQRRPYSLICRKNRAGYERPIAQRRQDLADIAALKGAPRGRKL
jgi:hypothetical protein